MKRQISDIISRYQQSAWNFYRKKKKYESVKKQYEALKEQFETEMLECFDEAGKKRITFSGDSMAEDDEVLTVNKVEKTSIEWFPDKLDKRVTRPIARQIIKKKYTIADMNGLSEYLKSCGVDPKRFASYLSIEKTVDQGMVDQLGKLGKLSVNNISGCYIVKCQKPYFTISVKKDNNDNGEEKE